MLDKLGTYVKGVWKEAHPSKGMYYYKCGSKIDKGNRLGGVAYTGEVHCTKSEIDFKEFDTPEDYGKITLITLSKEAAEKKMATGMETTALPIALVGGPAAAIGLLGAAISYTEAETGEDRILRAELGTFNYFIHNK